MLEQAALELEITESLPREDVAASSQKLRRLQALGVHIAIDDFGTGLASLAYLARLPLRTLKIDRSLIPTVLEEPQALTLVKTIVSLGQALRLTVVAEGVETEAQAKVLAASAGRSCKLSSSAPRYPSRR